ncbi:MAG: DUF2867 domain-containing protein [Aggregatilineales bacterium]
MDNSVAQRILVTGATGYIGGRLVPRLLDSGYTVRVMTRDARHLMGRSWLKDVEIIQGDVLQPDSLQATLEDVDVAYYLIHSMEEGDNFHERDAKAAQNFAESAKAAGVRQIIYLGGLGDRDTQELSEHLRSRQKVGEILREYGPPVTEFRAAVVVGSGSLSFEIIRYLTERIPIMICPSWVYTRVQPIGIDDILNYLTASLTTEDSRDQIIEVGGADTLTYRDMMQNYADQRDLSRFMIPVPFLTPRLSSYWVHLVTPVSANIARPLIKGLKNEVIADTALAEKLFPEIQPVHYKIALQDALEELSAHKVETSWTDSLAATWEQDEPYTFAEERGMMIEQRKRIVDATREDIYEAFTSLGGQTGWLYLDWLWRIRGSMDRVVGGPGYRRGRRTSINLRAGDTLDFWRVEAVKYNEMLRLRAEMKLPGRGWLQFEIQPDDSSDRLQLIQTAYYAPKGLFGYLYWYSIFFVHKFIFDGLIDRIVARAEGRDTTAQSIKRFAPFIPILLAIPTVIVALGMLMRDVFGDSDR